jgi:hypothetical protein
MRCEICQHVLEDDYGVWIVGKLACGKCVAAFIDLIRGARLAEEQAEAGDEDVGHYDNYGVIPDDE